MLNYDQTCIRMGWVWSGLGLFSDPSWFIKLDHYIYKALYYTIMHCKIVFAHFIRIFLIDLDYIYFIYYIYENFSIITTLI